MTFIIYGAGAIGCYVGGRLAAAGADVRLVGRPRVLDALARQGLRVSDQAGFDRTVPGDQLRLAASLLEAMIPDPGAQADPPVVLVCVKATGTAAAAQDIASACPPWSVVVSLQNGVENADRLWAGAPSAVVLAGMTPFTVNWRGEAQVHQASTGSLHLERSAESEQFAPALRAVGVPVALHPDMNGLLWGKLLLNLFNPINALANLPIREQLLQRDYRLVFAALQTEALGVLRAAHIQPAQVGGAPPHLLPEILRLPDDGFARVAAGMLKIDPSARTSMCADLQAGRPTEIGDLCGAVLRLAAKVGVPAPLNRAVSDLIIRYRLGEAWSGSALREALQL